MNVPFRGSGGLRHQALLLILPDVLPTLLLFFFLDLGRTSCVALQYAECYILNDDEYGVPCTLLGGLISNVQSC